MDYSKFIVFEGIDGSGKSTQCMRLASHLQKHAIPYHNTFEPYTGVVGSYVRNILKNPTHFSDEDTNIRSGILAYLFAADRYEHVYSKNGIHSLLSQNTVVICDRYMYSSLAYQGNTELHDLVKMLNKNFPVPDCIFYFDIAIDIALKRITRTKDIMEHNAFLCEVKKRYDRMFSSPLYNPYTNTHIPIYTIDAKKHADDITQEVVKYTLQLLKHKS